MKVAAIGECMVELRRAADGRFDLAYGGDTCNTAIYMSRLGVAVDYVTALGDDPFSDGIVELCRREHVGTGLIATVSGRRPGLYIIETDNAGERTFHYWRDRSPAREMFELSSGPRVAEALRSYGLIYISGITLSLYSERGLAILFAALGAARDAGARVVFDGNYRPAGWLDSAAARRAFETVLGHTDIALPTFEDDRMLYGDADPAMSVRRYVAAGIGEVVVKDGRRGCLVAHDNMTLEIETEVVPQPVDTTAAGDSFNAGYLAARLKGMPPAEAAKIGHRLAGAVIRHPGAVIPASEMPVFDEVHELETLGTPL